MLCDTVFAKRVPACESSKQFFKRLSIQNDVVETPEDPSVLFSVRELNPGESQTIHFNAPTAPGKYPYLCIFPGHWQSMKGTLVVY